MTIQAINIGTSPNDDTGDDPRTAGQKINANFTTNSHAASRDVGVAAGEIPDTGSLNNNYGALKASAIVDLIAIGEGRTSTQVRIYCPVSLLFEPQSITVTSTFRLVTPAGVDLKTGITSSDILFGSDSISTLVTIAIINITGAVVGQTYELRSETASSEIKVNP